MMALVWRPGELLLARSPHYAPGMFSALAGFVEAGESLEDCMHREVAEEVGVTVRNLRYYGSQSWPFPNSLMVAFTAEWAAARSCRSPARSRPRAGSTSTRCRASRRAFRSLATYPRHRRRTAAPVALDPGLTWAFSPPAHRRETA